MKKFLLTLFIFFYLFSGAQNPLVKIWDKRFGGTGADQINSIQETAEGGYILGGYSDSNVSGDKTQNSWGGVDFWIVKIDFQGIKIWDKDLGGTNMDQINSIEQTADGGYLLGGWSNSNIGGDKTQNSWGNRDYWIVKIDSLGNKLWDKDYGGSDEDYLFSVLQTTDGGYILGGYSFSDVSGDKTQNSWGEDDYWIIKIDSIGNKQWDKDIGGTSYDHIYSIQRTTDGGYILGGNSWSNINGNKTQNSWGLNDYWIVKIDSLGNIQWDKDFGGTVDDAMYSIRQTVDGGYILGGMSNSNISGEKTQDTWGNYDYWIVKIDSLGNKQWDKDFGGTGMDRLCSIEQTADGGYIIGGFSDSNISGDKTEANLGQMQTWILKTDSIGNKQWDKTIFTTGSGTEGQVIQTRDGCYAVANVTYGGVGGYKTQPSWNNSNDYWLVKFCDSTLATGNSTEPFMNVGIDIYPNPVETELRINNEELRMGTAPQGVLRTVEISIYNVLGEKFYTAVDYRLLTVDCRLLPSGMYWLEIKSGEKIFRSKFIKSAIH